MDNHQKFINKMYDEHLYLKGDVLDHIFEYFDDLFCLEKFDECDGILKSIDEYKLSTMSLIGVLSITLMLKTKLKNRSLFFDRVKKKLIENKESDLDRLLQGLE